MIIMEMDIMENGKRHADQFWHNHLTHYLKGKGFKNRYLTIPGQAHNVFHLVHIPC